MDTSSKLAVLVHIPEMKRTGGDGGHPQAEAESGGLGEQLQGG